METWLASRRNQVARIGFVPTMGALHEGHLSLIRASKDAGDLTVCSIFVNPTQFNDQQDFQKYPITTENDILLLEKQGTDLLFLPSREEIYAPGENLETYSLGYLETVFEGLYRPGHFQGVCQVMRRLLERVKPDDLFMGQKDFQQCLVIKELIRELGIPTQFHTVPTRREPDGLAMSSRNTRLSRDERSRSTGIFKALTYIKENLTAGNLNALLAHAQSMLDESGFRTEYIAIAKTEDLQPVNDWNGKDKVIALAAAFQGPVRLIDNMLLN